jgi:hypothetical protein
MALVVLLLQQLLERLLSLVLLGLLLQRRQLLAHTQLLGSCWIHMGIRRCM